MSTKSRLLGTGAYLPERTVTNDELANWLADQGVETSSDWIVARTGIEQRHFASESETTTYMGTQAARRALEAAGVSGPSLDMIVVATSTPDQVFPSMACSIQAELGAKAAFAFDIQAVCSGFVYALTVADSMIRSGQVRNALVVGAEVFSRLLDWQDRTTCVLFGDGAGAVYLQAAEGQEAGILACSLHSDGTLGEILTAKAHFHNGKIIGDPFLRMDGQTVFKQAVTVLGNNALDTLRQAGVEPSALSLLVPHQANIRILQAIAKKLGLTEAQTMITVNKHGNTSAASVPLALDQAVRSGRLQPGDLCLLQGVGGGFTWGSVLLRM